MAVIPVNQQIFDMSWQAIQNIAFLKLFPKV
jgi:hypothetical protein